MSTNLRYNTLSDYYEKIYGSKVAKISLNIGSTCPNRDGNKGFGGCIFCSGNLSGEFGGDKEKSIKEQFEDIKQVITKKWPNCQFIAYLQAGSNTYGDIDYLRQKYKELLDLDIVGIHIATRSDCINEKVIDLLKSLNEKKKVVVELGVQTTNNNTLKLINQQETFADFDKAYKLLKEANIDIVCHIINGLPYETKEDMLQTIKDLNKYDILGIKIHSLLVLKNTPLEKMYEQNKFHILSLEEYVDIVVSQLEIMNPNFIIYRVGADGSLDDLIEPKWTRKKLVIINEIDKLMRKKDSHQGIFYQSHE